ncbi:uncharacterized protein LOC125551064 isoform X3 [Triticum urartu]|nr:uncharacterized protein LOC125551064 isoform X3 [Triticum urartu]
MGISAPPSLPVSNLVSSLPPFPINTAALLRPFLIPFASACPSSFLSSTDGRAMVGPAAVRSGGRRRGRPPGIRVAVIARVRRAGDRLSSVDSSSAMAAAGGCGRPATVDSDCRFRYGPRRPFRSSRIGAHRFDSPEDFNVDVDSRRREISLGKRPVDCIIGSAISAGSSSAVDGFASAVRSVSVRPDSLSVQVVDGSNVCPAGFPAGVCLHGSLGGSTFSRCRPRVVPLCAGGAFGRPTPLGNVLPTPIMEHLRVLRVLHACRKRTVVRSYWLGRKRVRGMQPPFSKDYIQLLKATFRRRSYYGGPDLCCHHCGAFFWFREGSVHHADVTSRSPVYTGCCRTVGCTG